MEERLKVLLYNAISVLYDNTVSNETESTEWYDELKEKLGVTDDELKEFCGIECDKENGLTWN